MNRKNNCGILICLICIAMLCSCGNVRDVDMTNETYQENILQDNVENTEEDIKKDTENTENIVGSENTENTNIVEKTVEESDKSENYISESVVKKETGTLNETIAAPDLPLLSRLDSWPEEPVEIVPYDTEMTGAAGGYFLIPMEDGIYRYSDYDYSVQAMVDKGISLETDELLYTFQETGIEENHTWEIYSLKEYPDRSLLFADCVGFNSLVLSYAPELACEEDALEDARENVFVIMRNGSVIEGTEIWQDFVSDVENGQPAVVRLGYYYTLDKDNVSPELFEAEKKDYPMLFFKQLYYDGSSFTLSPVNKLEDKYVIYEKPGFNSPEVTYSFLMHYAGDSLFDFESFSAYDKYVLTNDDQVTWEQLWQSEISSLMGAWIPHEEVYCEYTWKNQDQKQWED